MSAPDASADDDRVDPPPSSRDYRYVAVALALAAAACFGYAAFAKSWLVRGNAIGFGLRECQDCRADPCLTLPNADMVAEWQADPLRGDVEYTSGAFSPMGTATFVVLFVAIVGLVGAAALALARKQPHLPIAPSTIALIGLAIALVTGCVFVATKPGAAGFVGVGPSFWVFGAGAIAGLAGASLLAKVNRPRDPDLMADAMNPDEF